VAGRGGWVRIFSVTCQEFSLKRAEGAHMAQARKSTNTSMARGEDAFAPADSLCRLQRLQATCGSLRESQGVDALQAA